MHWGFTCGDGWYALIDMLCGELQHETDHNGAPQVTARQVKEKFGRLRFYVDQASERQRGMIDLACAVSACICEECGASTGPAYLGDFKSARCVAHGG